MSNIYTWPKNTVIRLIKLKGYKFENDQFKLTKFGLLMLKKSFTWNGCSPKIVVFGMVFGTPEGVIDESTGESKTKVASGVHDLLLTYKKELKKIGITKKKIDQEFYCQLKKTGFESARLYYRAVRLLGFLF